MLSAPVSRKDHPNIGETVMISASDVGGRSQPVVASVAQTTSRFIELVAAEADQPQMLDSLRGAVEVRYIRASGLYQFGSVLSLVRSSRHRYQLAQPRDILRIQRRGEYRIPLNVPTTVYLAEKRLPASLVNLSGGGALIALAQTLAERQVVDLAIPIGKDGMTTEIAAEVIEAFIAGCRTYARLRFDNDDSLALPEITRDEIAKYVFEQQRIMLKVRKLMNTTGANGKPEISDKKRARILSALANWLRAPSLGWKR